MTPEHEAYLETFRGEADENLCTIEEGLVALESHPDDGELLNAIFRAAHTLKGNAAAFGLEAVVELAHAAEGVLDQLRDRRLEPTAALTTLMLAAVDALREMVPAGIRGDTGEPPLPRCCSRSP